MPRSDLQIFIERLLDKIADANGYGKGIRSRYRPLRGTQYTKVHKALFPEGSLPEAVMKEELFLDIRSALLDAEGARGLPCITRGDIEHLDRTWQSYRLNTLTAPDRLHARWEELVRDHNIRPSRMLTESDIYWTLYPILYIQMLRGDVDMFNRNNQAFLSGYQTRHAAIPNGEDARGLVWAVYCMIASFCHRRLGQKEGQLGCIRHLKRQMRSNGNAVIASELLSHVYYDNPASKAAFRALDIVNHHGVSDDWGDWAGYELGRAAISAINIGYGGNETCRELSNMTPNDALRRGADMMLENGHAIPAAMMKLHGILPDALNGDLDSVYKNTSLQVASARNSFGDIWLINDNATAFKAVAHFHASRGSLADLLQARNYVDQLSPYIFAQTGGRVRETIDKIIKTTDALHDQTFNKWGGQQSR